MLGSGIDARWSRHTSCSSARWDGRCRERDGQGIAVGREKSVLGLNITVTQPSCIRSARKVRKRLDYLQRSVSAPGYETRAPPEVQERDRQVPTLRRFSASFKYVITHCLLYCRDAINEHQLKLQAFDDRINVLRNLIGKQ